MKKATDHTVPLPSPQSAVRYERLNMALIYINSLLFSGLFSSASVQAYLVKAVFNGSGIIMVVGLLSIIVGNLWAHFSHPKAFAPWGSYQSLKILFYAQLVLLAAFSSLLVAKHL